MSHKLEDSRYVRIVSKTWPKLTRRFKGTEANDFYRYKSELYPCKHIHWIACGTSPAVVLCDCCRTAKQTFPYFRADLTTESRIREVQQMIALAEEALTKDFWEYKGAKIPYTSHAKFNAQERLPRLRERLKELTENLKTTT